MAVNLMMESGDVDDLTANTITMLFFLHPVVKLIYFPVRGKIFYKTLAIWNNPNSHPLFAESNARYHSLSITKMRRLLFCVAATTVFSVLAWTSITFMDESVKRIIDPETNETTVVPVSVGHLLIFLYPSSFDSWPFQALWPIRGLAWTCKFFRPFAFSKSTLITL
jgi:hypothetical protein